MLATCGYESKFIDAEIRMVLSIVVLLCVCDIGAKYIYEDVEFVPIYLGCCCVPQNSINVRSLSEFQDIVYKPKLSPIPSSCLRSRLDLAYVSRASAKSVKYDPRFHLAFQCRPNPSNGIPILDWKLQFNSSRILSRCWFKNRFFVVCVGDTRSSGVA